MAKFSVVTACRNAAAYIEQTVESVLQQSVFRSGACQLEYLVCDGASTDGTLERLRPYEKQGVRIVSQPDGGFYAALAKGLQSVSGDYVAYLNAGDFYHPTGLEIAAQCFALPGVSWLTGYGVVYNEASQVTQCSLPFRYRRALFACGAYGSRLPFLQQESTLWRRSLHETVDFAALARMRLAGDSYLWNCFAGRAEVHIVRGQIGGFRVHGGQLSERRTEYLAELASFSRAASLAERVRSAADRAAWWLPERLKCALNRSTMILYDHQAQAWSLADRHRAGYR